ncbi:hypothetical protein ACFQ80_05960 [Isoptericola sp. NPDC056578]|uniref:hypothetical protein n=1 Tax=Isoptericola sp. NPDC056578 TaxID=3345870 RepID=UPI0036B908AD
MDEHRDPMDGITVTQDEEDPYGWVISLTEGASLIGMLDQTRATIAQGGTPRVELAAGDATRLKRALETLVNADLAWVDVRIASHE